MWCIRKKGTESKEVMYKKKKKRCRRKLYLCIRFVQFISFSSELLRIKEKKKGLQINYTGMISIMKIKKVKTLRTGSRVQEKKKQQQTTGKCVTRAGKKKSGGAETRLTTATEEFSSSLFKDPSFISPRRGGDGCSHTLNRL